VANTIRNLARQAYTRERHLEVITCLREEPQEEGMLLTNFAPAGDFEVPEYPSQRLSFPPILELVEHLERQEFTELIISTPGPVGLVGLAASRMLNLPTVGIYHTDFPAYVRHLTEDSFLEQMTWRYMRWFYDQMDTVLVPTMSYFRQLSQHLDPVKLQVMDSGIDTDRFNPAHRVADFWRQHGLDGDFVFLYVGRVSQEKNIDDLIGAFRSLYGGGESISLAIVGDGPYLNRLKKSADHPQIAFTGALTGASLSAAYASADAFVFPSKTDTRGNVVMEALASGLATIVTDQGGPADIVRSHSSGIIAESSRKDALEMSMRRVLEDPVLRDELRRRGLSQAQRMSWRRAANALWDLDIRRPTKRGTSADLYAIPEATEEVAIQ
jgi:glycosyltransferase involved in cell wall biosynthesis